MNKRYDAMYPINRDSGIIPPPPPQSYISYHTATTNNHFIYKDARKTGIVCPPLRTAAIRQNSSIYIQLNERLNILKLVTIVILLTCIPVSCASLHAYSIVLTTAYNGNAVVENEKNVVLYMKNVIQNSDDCVMRAFDRKAISYKVKKTDSTTHSFYLIY
ncbi:MAG: hypothetical protein LBB48_00445, partial [Treponema sp.]|nr:hypothetical protein [Treponema sp.]